MKLEKLLSKDIGVRVYDYRKHNRSWSVKTKTKLAAYQVAYCYRHKRQVQVIATDETATSWTVRIANQPIYDLDPDSPVYVGNYPGVWDYYNTDWLTESTP